MDGCGEELRKAGFIVRWNWATEYPSSSADASELVSFISPRQKLMNFGGSGISWPVPLSLMKETISLSTSQSSRAKRIFSHD